MIGHKQNHIFGVSCCILVYERNHPLGSGFETDNSAHFQLWFETETESPIAFGSKMPKTSE